MVAHAEAVGSQARSPLVVASLVGGLVAGTIDVGAASLITGKDPVFILHIIAGGLLAKASFAGGTSTAILGLLLQWAMGIIIAAIFVIAARLQPWIGRQWFWTGPAYGVPIFAVMNYVVVPLSAWHKFPKFTPESFLENLLAMIVFGAIVAGVNRALTRASTR
jgi:hypothetical protein